MSEFSRHTTRLVDLQRQLQEWILGRPPQSADEVESLITRSATQAAHERLAIYQNAYRARLLECLRAEFPAVVKLVGEEAFTDLAGAYLQEVPSTHPSLSELGREFPIFLARSRPPRATDDTLPDFADLIIELARLERLYQEVFDGPGLETDDTPPLTLPATIEEFSTLPLQLAPCVRLLTCMYPVHEFASAVRHHVPDDELTLPSPEVTHLVIARRDYVVRRFVVEPAAFQLLQKLAAGVPVGDVLADCFSQTPVTSTIVAEKLGRDLRRWFEEWFAARLFVHAQSS